MKYKTLKETPFASSKDKFEFTKFTKIVTKERFFEFDGLIPLLVANQWQIYPDKFKSLELLKNRTIAIVSITYLSGIESKVKEYFLDTQTINKIKSSFQTI